MEQLSEFVKEFKLKTDLIFQEIAERDSIQAEKFAQV
jgi:hypothetical protein